MNLLFWKKKKKPKTRYIKYFLYAVLAYLVVVIWPVKGLLMPSFLFGNHLVIFTNEAEARPCGGFVTAFGEVSLLPPKFQLKNSYHLEDEHFGLTTFPLSRVADKRQFWDLGDTTDLAICAKGFQYAYEQVTDAKIDHVFLLDLGTVESLLSLLGTIDFDGKAVSSDQFFSYLSRTVADVDRHDESSLSMRKTPLAMVGKKAIGQIALRPWKWWQATRILSNSLATGSVYNEHLSPKINIEPNDFALIEWNLGGGKSSRFLSKEMAISAREYAPNKWNMTLDFSAHHLGGEDEPVSQLWKGVFNLKVPSFLADEEIYWEAQIAPGEKFTRQLEWQFEGQLEEGSFSVFIPRGQRVFAKVDVMHAPQKQVTYANVDHHENIVQYRGYPTGYRKDIEWSVTGDTLAPFVTMHEVVSPNFSDEILGNFPENPDKKYFYAEIHFNELVELNENFGVMITDRNFENDQTEDPTLVKHLLLKDQKTLLLQFTQSEIQKDERYYLQLSGVADLWGNQIKVAKRTLITR